MSIKDRVIDAGIASLGVAFIAVVLAGSAYTGVTLYNATCGVTKCDGIEQLGEKYKAALKFDAYRFSNR